MSTVMDVSFDSIFDIMSPMKVELSFVIFFALGFVFLRLDLFRSEARKAKKAEASQTRLHKTIEADCAAGQVTAAVKLWRRTSARAPAQLETLKLITQALLEADPTALVKEITGHMAAHRGELCNSRTAATVLDVVARAGQVAMMEELCQVFDQDLKLQPSTQIYEILLGGYATAGDDARVAQICSELRAKREKISPRGYSLSIKGFLKNGMVDAALKQTLEMHRTAYTIPGFAVTQLIRASCEVGRGMETFQAFPERIPIPSEAIACLLEDCLRRSDLPQARQIEQISRRKAGSSPLCLGAYDALLKLCAVHGDCYALELFEEMKKEDLRISEGLCVGLLARCAETKYLRFAEEIVKHVRARDAMTISVYSALMKVYAYSGKYSKACDLYDEIIAQGMEPDAMMYGCLMKFSVECGRTDLSRELFSKAPSLDIQNYMSLIKAAGRDKDIDRAFQVLQKLKETSMKLDVAVYNCVLDACVTAGDMPRARELVAEMRAIDKFDVITYNTLLKGLCTEGDIRGAKELLAVMERTGMRPNDVSFNCLINAAVSKGMWQEAWSAIDMMERSGVQVDHYTLSTMMKALKRTKNSKDVARALALLDSSGLDVCSDEVLLNTVLETCIRHREHRRLETVIDAFSKSSIQPSVHTYGSLVKACSAVKRADKCWNLWNQMVDDRGLEPNDIVLGCMLDALVCNNHVEEAVALFYKWQAKVHPNTIMYSTLIKGFANTRQGPRAMDMWHEMHKLKLPMNTVVFNALIDSQARIGFMDEVSLLVRSMQQHGCAPDNITYSLIVKGYCFRGDLNKAFEVLRDMQQNNMASDSVIYNTVLDGCVRHNRMDLAETLLQEMDTFKIVPSNFTLGILVKMYGRHKQLEKAFKLIEEMPKKHGFAANVQVRMCLMCACLNNHDVTAALKVFEELRTTDDGADWKTYATIISGVLQHGWVEKALTLLEDAYGLTQGKAKASLPIQNFASDSLEQLLKVLVQRGQMESMGIPLLHRLRAARIPVSGKILSTFT
mmetsp:Transcript_162355/g.311713  ORF Transcript_162355/g.311713 Transcript_162355/m.311713 type:complete len:1014 (+) Transcript_162355:137-3178(+)